MILAANQITRLISVRQIIDASNKTERNNRKRPKSMENGPKFQVARRARFQETWVVRRDFNLCRAIGQLLISNTVVLNLDIFPICPSIRNILGVPSLCNLLLQKFSFFFIQTLPNDCSHIEDVHLLFCAHFIIFFSFLRVVELRHFFHQQCLWDA